MKKFLAILVIVLPLGFLFVAAWFIYRWLTGSVEMSEEGVYDFKSNASRELLDNNILGLTQSKTFVYKGVDLTRSVPNIDGDITPGVDRKTIYVDGARNDGHLMIFQTQQDGMDNAAKLMCDRYFNGGEDGILYDMAVRWSGDTHDLNHDGLIDYAEEVAQIMKLPVKTSLHFATDGIKFMIAISRMENGSIKVKNVPIQMWQRAVAYALTKPSEFEQT